MIDRRLSRLFQADVNVSSGLFLTVVCSLLNIANYTHTHFEGGAFECLYLILVFSKTAFSHGLGQT